LPHVLVTDDDPGVLRLISLILDLEGLDCTCVTNGHDALEVIARRPVDLLILDLEMPEMDGRTLYREASQAGYSGPVLVLSAFEADRARRELDATASLDKPFEPDYFVGQINHLLEARAGLGGHVHRRQWR
jgi:DNA-binding response OmpR family regulator